MLVKNEGGQSRIDNPETLSTLGTQDTENKDKKKHTTQRTKQMSNTDPPTNLGFTLVFPQGKQFLLLIKTTAMLLI